MQAKEVVPKISEKVDKLIASDVKVATHKSTESILFPAVENVDEPENKRTSFVGVLDRLD